MRSFRKSVPVVDGALGFWSASNVAPMMTSSDFETSPDTAQRWLANFRPKDNSACWRGTRTVRVCCRLLLKRMFSPMNRNGGLKRSWLGNVVAKIFMNEK